MKVVERVRFVASLFLLMLAACTGSAGPVGPAGPSFPVIQSLSAIGLPAAPGGTVTLRATTTGADATPLSYSWNVTPSSWTITAGASTDTVTLRAPAAHAALGTATLFVSDVRGHTATGIVTLTTNGNGTPMVQTLSASPNPVRKGNAMVLTAAAFDPDGDTLTYTWEVPAGFVITSGQGTASAVVTPTTFASGTVTVTVDDGTTSAVGRLFVSTLAAAWGEASPMEQASGDADGARVAVDAEGNAMVVWYQRTTATTNIWARRFSATTGWENPALLENDDTGDAYTPVVAFDAQGNAMVVWYQWDGARFDILSKRYVKGIGWEPMPALVENDDTGTAFWARVGVAANGRALAVWQQDDGTGRYDIWGAVYLPGGGWGAPALIEGNDLGSAQYPEVAVGSAGDAAVVWQQFDGTRDNVWGNNYVVSTGWVGATLLEQVDDGPAWLPDVGVDGYGRAIATWEQVVGTVMSVYANRFRPGVGWEGAAAVETGVTASSRYPRIAMNDAGDALIVFSQNQTAMWHHFGAYYRATTGLQVPAQIETSETGENWGGVHAAIDGRGNGVAVWSHSINSRNEIWTNRSDVGLAWGVPQRLDRGTGNASLVDVALNANGDGLAAFAQADATRYRMFACMLE